MPPATRHMSEAFDFLGFRIQWRRKQGTSKWYACTFIAARCVRAVKAKIRALDRRDPDRPVSLPRRQDPHPLGTATHLTADTVESPLRRKAHGGFGERSGETDREQSRHRAPGLLSERPPRSHCVADAYLLAAVLVRTPRWRDRCHVERAG